MQVAVIIPAAGSGRRFANQSGADDADRGKSKIELDLAGRPVLLWSIEQFARRADVCQTIVAVAPDQIDDFRLRHGDRLGLLGTQIVPGGELERWQTVQRAIEHVSPEATHIAVHDAARPLVTRKLIDRVFEQAALHSAVIPATPVSNTLKRVAKVQPVDGEADPLAHILGQDAPTTLIGKVVDTVDRSELVQVQTPQVFEAPLLRRAYQLLAGGGVETAQVTDDARLIELIGESVFAVEGDPHNLKVTVPDDLLLVRLLAQARMASDAKARAGRALFGDDDDDVD